MKRLVPIVFLCLFASAAFAAEPSAAPQPAPTAAITPPAVKTVAPESETMPNDEDVIDPDAGMLGDEYMGDPGELPGEVED